MQTVLSHINRSSGGGFKIILNSTRELCPFSFNAGQYVPRDRRLSRIRPIIIVNRRMTNNNNKTISGHIV